VYTSTNHPLRKKLKDKKKEQGQSLLLLQVYVAEAESNHTTRLSGPA
jgi:hypothetical protein